MAKIHNITKDFHKKPLSRSGLKANPMDQFADWFDQAHGAEVPESNAMTFASVNADGQPSARIVLLKEYNHEGFVFFTNYGSSKAQDIEGNSSGALLFWWQPLARQVRIEGKVKKIVATESDAYFAARKRESNIGAYASKQSKVIADRDEMEQAYAKHEKQFEGVDPIPRPDFWGGYILIPEEIEFWQGNAQRLHDRFRYRKEGDDWIIERLAS